MTGKGFILKCSIKIKRDQITLFFVWTWESDKNIFDPLVKIRK